MTFRTLGLLNIGLFIIVMLFTAQSWHYSMLTVAQIVFVPLILHMVTSGDNRLLAKILPYVSMPAFIAAMLIQVIGNSAWNPILAVIYFVFTALVSLYGLIRFLKRGFTHIEEFFIDVGLMYLVIGGAWFFAYTTEMNTGFSPIITWLTGIHFHYSAFILLISVGLLGRLYRSTLYVWAGVILMISPMVVALGITFSVWLELISVIIYIIGIYSLIIIVLKTPFRNNLQHTLLSASFAALGITILFSLFYAYGNLSGTFTVTIDFMLRFHGILNTCLFALLGVTGWMLRIPQTKYKQPTFPVSHIRGKVKVGEDVLKNKTDEQKSYDGLVDQFKMYEPEIDTETLAPAIRDFYENTNDYRLLASVKWKPWFKPFAAIYKLISKYVKQLNLPLSSRKKEMTGQIIGINDEIDGRKNVRAWVRKMGNETIFIALYSAHEINEHIYMNIALPLPGSSMHGILILQQSETTLRLTSKKRTTHCDAGIYLAVGSHIMSLPLEEQFDVRAISEDELTARHTMWIFNIPFLMIDYEIKKR